MRSRKEESKKKKLSEEKVEAKDEEKYYKIDAFMGAVADDVKSIFMACSYKSAKCHFETIIYQAGTPRVLLTV